jgi:hypothetical protein
VLTGLAARASLWNRRRKLALFLDELHPGPETTIVDVGVGDTGFDTQPGVALSHNFFEAMYPWPDRISNAVVEHVGGRDEQRRFVHELCRVAPRVFVSTPNRRFPVEVHTLVPFLHWLPRPARNRAFAALRRDAWSGVELLNRRELLALFPPETQARVVESRMTISVVAERSFK